MKLFKAVLFVLLTFLIGGITGFVLVSSGALATTNPICTSVRQEERRVFDLYTFLISRQEIRDEADRRSIEREFHDKLADVIKDGVRKGCL